MLINLSGLHFQGQFKFPMILNSKKKEEGMKAFLRIKPCQSSFLSAVSENSVAIRGEVYPFDRVYDEKTTNQQIFEEIGDPLIKHSLQGFNSSVLAYGQTASGKTFTMKGDLANQGLIPLTIRKLFNLIESNAITAGIKISYIEIYNQNIIDLLSGSQKPLDIHESMKNVSITNLTESEVADLESAMLLFEAGESRRKISNNNINIVSSRSHTIFRINITVVNDDYSMTQSSINMVDLAGSEGVNKTRAEGYIKKEGENINKSILALTNVFRGMSEKLNYVNFRDSKLTRLLQSSFCSNSKSAVICTINPSPQNFQQTINTVKFGMYASEIKLLVKRNLKQNPQQYKKPSQNSNRKSFSLSEYKDKISHQKLRAVERVEFEENKRIMNELREECRQYRQIVKDRERKIEYIELQNQRLKKHVEILEQDLEKEEARRVACQKLQEGDIYIYDREISTLKEEMNVMADRYEALNEIYKKTLQNQRYLVDRISRYESEIAVLKEVLQKEDEKNEPEQKPKTPMKMNSNIFPNSNKRNREIFSPLTIGSIMRLKASIVELKMSLYEANEQIACLVEERNEISDKLLEMQEQNDNLQHKSSHQLTNVEQREIKNLNKRVRKLKNELNSHKVYEKKLIKRLKEKSTKGMEEIEEFHEWYEKKMRAESAKKNREREQANLENEENKEEAYQN